MQFWRTLSTMSKVQNKFCQPTDNIVKWVQVLSSSFMPTFGIFFMYGQHRHSFQTAFSWPKTTDFSYRSTHDFLGLSLVITSATPLFHLDATLGSQLSLVRLLETVVVTRALFMTWAPSVDWVGKTTWTDSACSWRLLLSLPAASVLRLDLSGKENLLLSSLFYLMLHTLGALAFRRWFLWPLALTNDDDDDALHSSLVTKWKSDFSLRGNGMWKSELAVEQSAETRTMPRFYRRNDNAWLHFDSVNETELSKNKI